jgi:hypothetical protein
MIFSVTQKLDVMKHLSKAIFLSDLYCNYSRLTMYSSLLVEVHILII